MQLCHIKFVIRFSKFIRFLKKNWSLWCLQAEDIGERIEKIRIGHDNAGLMSGWHLEKVEVRRLKQEGQVRGKYGTLLRLQYFCVIPNKRHELILINYISHTCDYSDVLYVSIIVQFQ